MDKIKIKWKHPFWSFLGNLSGGEILEQIWHARQRKPDVSNVVFMGMGEPLENYDAVLEAIRGKLYF
jgi:adenine C2-methylase RlmN of 23S rRNA A2503 and tRNA A37